MSDDATMIVSAYFDAWRAHDPAALRGLLADDATFTGPLGHSENADDYREAIGRMFAITTGIVIRKMIANGDDVLTWFDLHTSVAPPAAVANWSQIKKPARGMPRVLSDAMVSGSPDTHLTLAVGRLVIPVQDFWHSLAVGCCSLLIVECS